MKGILLLTAALLVSAQTSACDLSGSDAWSLNPNNLDCEQVQPASAFNTEKSKRIATDVTMSDGEELTVELTYTFDNSNASISSSDIAEQMGASVKAVMAGLSTDEIMGDLNPIVQAFAKKAQDDLRSKHGWKNDGEVRFNMITDVEIYLHKSL